MSSPSSNNVEEDAWLMKIELKREEPVEAVKGHKSKEATGDQAPVVEQAWPAEEEEEDISLNLTITISSPPRSKHFGSSKRFVCKINISPVRIFCIKSTSSPSGASSVDWRIS